MPAVTPHDKPPALPSAPQSEEVSVSDTMQGWQIYKFCFSLLYGFVLVSLCLITELTSLCNRRVTQGLHRPSTLATSCSPLSMQGKGQWGRNRAIGGRRGCETWTHREWPSYRATPTHPRRCLPPCCTLRALCRPQTCNSITCEAEGRRIATGSRPVRAME